MKALLTTSRVCSVASLVGLLGLSAMSVAPGAENWHRGMTATVAVFFAAWLGLAIWSRGQLRRSAGAATVPPWLRTAVVIAGVVYVLLGLLCAVG
jgi:hypothetical protein